MLKFLIFCLICPTILGQSPPTPFPPPSCDGVDDLTFIASHNDCRLYYMCISGTAFQLQCPRGNYFSTERQTCVPYAESDCPLLTPPPPPGPPTCDDVPEFGYIPSLDACEYYYQCFGGEQWLLKCPRGLYFSFELQTCVRPYESDCPLIQTPSPPPPPPTGTPPPPPTGTPPQTAPPLPTPSSPPQNSCEDENCYENIERSPIFNKRRPREHVNYSADNYHVIH